MEIKRENSPLSAMSQYRPRISCQLCGKEFSQLDKLSFHIYNNCKDDVENISTDENRSTAVIDPTATPEDNPNGFPDQNGTTESEDGSGRLHICDICGKQFPKLQNLQVHVRSHTGEKPYSCQWCSKTFTSYGNMKAHSRVHTGLRPHQCPTCGKEFGTAQNLQVHIRTHTGERPYKCSECGKGFAGQGNLKVHQRTHTGERPYKCQMCGKDFRNLQSLHIHVRSHTGEKPYECSFCHKAFTSQGNMQAHMRIHTGERPFSCGECDKSFANMQALKIHIRTHTGERPHVCHVCGKDFASLGNFQVHMRTHSGLKPFTCRMCAHEFLTLSSMQEHMVRTHATELYAENALLWSRMQHLSAMQMQMPGTSGGADSSLLGPGLFSQAGFPAMDFSSLGLEQMLGMNQKPASATATSDDKDVPMDDSKDDGEVSSDVEDRKLQLSASLPSTKVDGLPSIKSGGLPNIKSGGLPNIKSGGLPNIKSGGLPSIKSGGISGSKAGGFASTGSDTSLKIPDHVTVNMNHTVDEEQKEDDSVKSETLTRPEEPTKTDVRISKICEKYVEDSMLDGDNPTSKHLDLMNSIKTFADKQVRNGTGLNSNANDVFSTVKPRSSIHVMATEDKVVFDTGRDGKAPAILSSPPRSASKVSDTVNSPIFPSQMPTSADGVSEMLGPSFGHLPGKTLPEVGFGPSGSDAAFGGLATRPGTSSSLRNSELFNSRMHTKTSVLDSMDADAPSTDVFSMNRTMQYGYHLPPLSSFALPNEYALNVLRGQGSTPDPLYNVSESAVNMFGYMNPPSFMPSVGPSKHFMDMFSLPGVQGHGVEGQGHSTIQGHNAGLHGQRSDVSGNSIARNSFQMSQGMKQSISPSELNTFVQTALEMFNSEKTTSNSQYSDVLDLKVNQTEEPSYCGSGGPVFPTNM